MEYAVRRIARTLDFPCAERLQPALVPMGQALASHGELELSPDLLERLGRISVSTVGRMVQRMRRDGHPPRLARRRPPSRNPLTRSIPAGRLPRDLPEPGHFEVDLVHHAGDSASGAQPAFDHLCAATALDPQRQATLAELRSTTNPLQLRNEVHALLDRLSRLPSARPGRPQDVRRTLFQPIHETASVTLSIEGSFTAR